MFKIRKSFDNDLENKYSRRFKKYGATAEGSYWISKARQELRFEIMIKEMLKLQNNLELSIGDIGCGYGALVNYIATKYNPKNIRYFGADISTDLIKYCTKNYDLRWAKFTVGSKPHSDVDVCLMSGTYNLAATHNALDWENHIFKNLTECWSKTQKMLIFNLQTSDTTHISSGKIFYANKKNILNRCNAQLNTAVCVEHIDLPFDTTFVIKKNNSRRTDLPSNGITQSAKFPT
ncbi:class I SAM-dependent methyltransferase [Ascidiaceihabitans sp.]|nr:class I SAM-dependent methyltransferase [Ascidiaceihabitans sp.]